MQEGVSPTYQRHASSCNRPCIASLALRTSPFWCCTLRRGTWYVHCTLHGYRIWVLCLPADKNDVRHFSLGIPCIFVYALFYRGMYG
ncbi:hypothetical protein BDV38DRAFT_262823 [Aspergillus pseudotamarii]|uniref:Uncharacterized protein n=1 Tax=Aspergillus pseudotamarii TaxID=132259 RepID=A0A5N6SBG4_ASPPS|nr:uncharacterized protein BDV38DRAFT_262823 [Aspergillus pseudotamarii]KAE8131945.1 hypothetical protein BDV38DRAFT_262823 [Aspergillus pseudotamarii]